ncbi:MAG TPA: hypothetical protein VIR54_15740 [Vicinamibacterales bacterium]
MKILRDEVAGDPARRHRLMEEARTAAHAQAWLPAKGEGTVLTGRTTGLAGAVSV